jgi:hypothetical protein
MRCISTYALVNESSPHSSPLLSSRATASPPLSPAMYRGGGTLHSRWARQRIPSPYCMYIHTFWHFIKSRCYGHENGHNMSQTNKSTRNQKNNTTKLNKHCNLIDRFMLQKFSNSIKLIIHELWNQSIFKTNSILSETLNGRRQSIK